MQQFRLPKIDAPKLELPLVIGQVIETTKSKLAHRPKLAKLFENCFPNTLATTTKLMDDGTTFVFTGDIPAMWLRDSAEQVMPYIQFAKDDPIVRRIIGGLVRRHMFYIGLDPYANAFNETENGWHWDANDQTDMSDWVWERKYELDSMCFSVRLAYLYWKETGQSDVFDARTKEAFRSILRVWKAEQRHFEQSPYRFMRENCPDIDTLRNDGLGMPVNYTGMTWSGFRPSDDACDYHYNIPSNMFAVVALRQMRELLETVYRDRELAEQARKLEKEIDHGIRMYGTYSHPKYGSIYAFETDGYGNHCLMDDAGTPSLLSIPYIGYVTADDPVYQNTRRFVLSPDNPFYFEGKTAKGVGSPHTPPGYVWHLALTMQGLTSIDPQEMRELIDVLEATDAGTGYMHEGFLADDPNVFTRDWFAWSNSQFSLFVLRALEQGII